MSAEEPLEVSPDDGTISGKSVVISMFVLAVVLIGALYTYWNLHLMPFMPLQEALAAETLHLTATLHRRHDCHRANLGDTGPDVAAPRRLGRTCQRSSH